MFETKRNKTNQNESGKKTRCISTSNFFFFLTPKKSIYVCVDRFSINFNRKK
jgi:hypothetical protein